VEAVVVVVVVDVAPLATVCVSAFREVDTTANPTQRSGSIFIDIPDALVPPFPISQKHNSLS
jgi:hypothetical protein